MPAPRPQPPLDGVSHHEVQAGAVRLHYAEMGAGAGPPVVLLHGWPQHWYCWHRIMPALAARHRVLAFDLRGFGWSEAPAGGYDKETLARDVLAALDALGIDRVRLVAHDWGGVAGFHMCLLAPERIEGYVALNTGHLWPRPSRTVARHIWRLYWYQSLMMVPGLSRVTIRLVAGLIGRVCRSYGAWDARTAATYLNQLRDPARVDATAKLYRAFMLGELPANLRGRYRDTPLTVRTLMLHGRGDPVISPRLVEGFAGRADDFELVLLPRVGHFSPEEAPDEVLRRIEAFFG